MKSVRSKMKQYLLFLSGIIILTFGARILLLSGLGVGGLDAVAIRFAELYGISIGTMIFILGMILVITGDLINKKGVIHPLITSIMIGYAYDLWGKILFDKLVPPQTEGWIGFVYLVGLLLAPIGAALYMFSHISMGPVDYLMVAIKEHTRLSIGTSRTLLETLFVITGWLMRGPIGMGTIGIMLFWGVILQTYYSIGLKLLKDGNMNRYRLH